LIRGQTTPGLGLPGIWEESVPQASHKQYGGIKSIQEADILQQKDKPSLLASLDLSKEYRPLSLGATRKLFITFLTF
jgi:hypothetical protein